MLCLDWGFWFWRCVAEFGFETCVYLSAFSLGWRFRISLVSLMLCLVLCLVVVLGCGPCSLRWYPMLRSEPGVGLRLKYLGSMRVQCCNFPCWVCVVRASLGPLCWRCAWSLGEALLSLVSLSAGRWIQQFLSFCPVLFCPLLGLPDYKTHILARIFAAARNTDR